MVQHFKKIGLAFALLMTLSACYREEPVYNVENNPLPAAAEGQSSGKIGETIAHAAFEKGWAVSRTQPGTMRCTRKWMSHTAIIDISYTAQSYSIRLYTSDRLNQEEGNIHPKYNEEIQELQKAIDQKLSEITYN